MNVLITGGAGFIGSNFIRFIIEKTESTIVNLDLLTYAANLEYLKEIQQLPNYHFIQGNIKDSTLVMKTIQKFKIDCIINFAAESHVDNSIKNAEDFIQTNIVGTANLLECARLSKIRYLQISTDEVYGSLTEGYADEKTFLNPSSPYSASKAAADHLVMSYHKTYDLNINIVRAANNYGPNQYKEKLIPLMLHQISNNKPLPIYGNGLNKRDWLYVEDFCRAIFIILECGKTGEIYNVSAHEEIDNLTLVKKLCHLCSYDERMIEFVEDRLGHDYRYAMETSKIESLGWKPKTNLEEGLIKTVKWYSETKQLES
ncbi:dTDP-glucose 4,6-dehydratase [Enterococcus sp. FDAARGOS_375]|uniref:dTDP-glucose 4,6-dehydratase n=1 Tax=Enterococcus sp. FDAARGOS_375 TaxID=2060307 RepID=UPI000BBD0FE9|nr:dTDP-glucose 4,6-dehydratase [Enterococcus sp. FDAARGOS_375]ATF70892.1 dTDP-glucose 4,6-dehydratase [Enterococcus sp. FDAARGOS_375]